jgi:hypothetical protein
LSHRRDPALRATSVQQADRRNENDDDCGAVDMTSKALCRERVKNGTVACAIGV